MAGKLPALTISASVGDSWYLPEAATGTVVAAAGAEMTPAAVGAAAAGAAAVAAPAGGAGGWAAGPPQAAIRVLAALIAEMRRKSRRLSFCILSTLCLLAGR